MPESLVSESSSSRILSKLFRGNGNGFMRGEAQAQMISLPEVTENCLRFLDLIEANVFRLLLMAICIITEILIFISHLQRFLLIFQRRSIFFDRKMNAAPAPNKICFYTCKQLWTDISATDLLKKIANNCNNLASISIFARALEN